MRLLVDTDVFCKLAACGLLHESLKLFGLNLSDCGRLPALHHMLQRGKLRKLYGATASDAMIPTAMSIPIATQANVSWLDKLTQIQAIDPGEAQLFAIAAESSLIVLTSDKRALRALKNVPDFPNALAGRVVVFEAILLKLSYQLGSDFVRQRVQVIAGIEKMVQACFSQGNPSPQDCLLSYYRSLVAELDPLVLWNPR